MSLNPWHQSNTHFGAQDFDAAEVSWEDSRYTRNASNYDDLPNRDGSRLPSRKKGKGPDKAMLASLSDAGSAFDESFEITYVPARYEAVWLRDSLRPFVDRGLLEDVYALIKGGKEANVYLCDSPSELGNGLIAAKVYRPRQFRNLRNDKMYREGREILDSRGEKVFNQDNREMRAIRKKTSFGQSLTHTSWLMHEYGTLTQLYAAGVSVPRPISAGENAILMEYIGGRNQPAPLLHAVSLSHAEALRLHREVLRCITVMLSQRMIHGDLSAYNILYWEGNVTLIDFPQVTVADANSNAYSILRRDVVRVAEYFAAQGVDSDPLADVNALWDEHVRLPRPGRPGRL